MTKVAVTGASGFIGSHLLPKLLRSGIDVRVLDFGGDKYIHGVDVVKGDLFSGEGVGDFLDGADVVIHLAGQVLSGKTSMTKGNLKTTENLVSEALKSQVKKIIFSSSIAVYGDSQGKIFTENDSCKPNTDYGKSKLAAESVINDWAKKTGGQSIIFRLFSIYGPGNKKGVVYNICKDFISKGEVNVFGTGYQRRDLVYIDDVTDLLTLAVSKELSGIYNVGGGEYYSILDLISILEKISGEKCGVTFQKSETDKVDEIIYSIDKLKTDFKWKAEVDIKKGVEKVYRYLLANEK